MISLLCISEKFNTLTDVDENTSFDQEHDEDYIQPHIQVNHVEKIGDNEFSIHAYLNEVFNETGDYFNEKFSSYAESMYDLDPLFDGTKISVRTFNASLSEFENDTSVWFILKTFDIEILDTDLDMNGSLTVFDEIFEKFNLNEFKAHFLDVEKEAKIAEDDDEEAEENRTTTTVADQSTPAIDETTVIDSTTDEGVAYTENDDVYVVDAASEDLGRFSRRKLNIFPSFSKKNFILDEETAPAQFKRRIDVQIIEIVTNSASLSFPSPSVLLLVAFLFVQ